ncbi:MAG: ABC transporter substrate-binding protein, partial [Lachnospiraceae bacterium]|nr:ABC transporter substrate-binding protein [Lachnospiraceae bacterium]
EAEAEAAFGEQAAAATEERENTGKTVAFFYITSSGTFNVRNSDDYVAPMIELAGGRYIFDDLSSGNATGTTSIQVEEFLAAAADVDYLIYNTTIEGEMESIDDLLERCPQLADCRAVQEGHVFTTGKSMYQSVMELGTVVSDIHAMLTGEGGMVYIEPLG